VIVDPWLCVTGFRRVCPYGVRFLVLNYRCLKIDLSRNSGVSALQDCKEAPEQAGEFSQPDPDPWYGARAGLPGQKPITLAMNPLGLKFYFIFIAMSQGLWFKH
jgi:hypothetical protein